MKRKLLYLVSLLSLVCIQSVKGQTITQIDWSKYASVIDDVITTDETNPIYILLWDYSIRTNDAFLTNGGTYGMQGTISNIGNRFYITKTADNHYLIHSNTNNPLGEALGNCMSVNFFNSPFGEKDDFGCMTVISGTDIFMDRGGVKIGSEGGKAHTASMPNWDFYKFDENNSYWICNTDIRGDKSTGEIKVDSYGWADDNNGYRSLYISGITGWAEPGKEGSIKMTTTDYVNYTAKVTFPESNSEFKVFCGKGWNNAEYGATTQDAGITSENLSMTLGKNKDVAINNIKTSLTGTWYVSFNIGTKELTVSATNPETAATEPQQKANAALYIDQNAEGKPLSYSAKDGVSHLWCIITEQNYREVVRSVRDNSYVDVSGIVHDGGFNRFNVYKKDWKPLDKDNNALSADKLDQYGNVKDLIENATTSNEAYNLNKNNTDETMKNLLGYKPYLIGGALLEKNIRDKYRTYGDGDTASDAFKDWNDKKQPWNFWRKYGDDFCAGIYCNGGYRQEITGLIKGTYHVKCTAFATNGGSGMLRIKGNDGKYKTVAFKVLDTGGEAAFNGKKSGVVKDARRHLWLAPVIEPEATTAETESSANPLAGLNYYYQGLDIIAAAQLLEEEKGKYTIGVDVELTGADNNTLTIEFWNTQTDDPLAKPVFVDNIQVFYEDVKYVTYISANQADYTKVDKYEYKEAVDLYVRRAFTEGKWNSIVLPFDITTANVVSAFGDGAVLSKLEGINPDRRTQIRFNKTEKLEAGECGLVFVPEGANENHATLKDYNETTKMKVLNSPITMNLEDVDEETYWNNMQNITTYKDFSGPLYNFGKVTRSKKEGDDSGVGYVTFGVDGGTVVDCIVSKNYITDAGTLEYVGYYFKPKKDGNNEKWPKDSYIVYDGDMYHLSTDWGVKYATMWYLKDPDPQNASMSRTFVINGIADNTVTEISGVVIDNGKAETGRIYNLNGQYMGDNASKDNLPKGLYIMNGKKFIVR